MSQIISVRTLNRANPFLNSRSCHSRYASWSGLTRGQHLKLLKSICVKSLFYKLLDTPIGSNMTGRRREVCPPPVSLLIHHESRHPRAAALCNRIVIQSPLDATPVPPPQVTASRSVSSLDGAAGGWRVAAQQRRGCLALGRLALRGPHGADGGK
jgi:hypothetical protein